MLRVVLDVDVLVSAAISREGPPGRALAACLAGAFELVASPKLVAELDDVLARRRVAAALRGIDVVVFRRALLEAAWWIDDPPAERRLPADPGDDYLVALAVAAGAHLIVTGDRHLLDAELAGAARAIGPAEFARLLERRPE